MTEITKQQSDSDLKVALLQSFGQFYQNLTGFLNKLNLEPILKANCFLNLDQGAMWAREAILALQFSQKETKPEGTEPSTNPDATAEL